MWKLIVNLVAGILGIWLATKLVSGVEFTGSWLQLLIVGVVLGLINFFVKPILNLITLPLRILTFGLFGLVINMGIIWLVDLFFPELIILGIGPLFWTAIIIWLLNWFLPKWWPEKRETIK